MAVLSFFSLFSVFINNEASRQFFQRKPCSVWSGCFPWWASVMGEWRHVPTRPSDCSGSSKVPSYIWSKGHETGTLWSERFCCCWCGFAFYCCMSGVLLCCTWIMISVCLSLYSAALFCSCSPWSTDLCMFSSLNYQFILVEIIVTRSSQKMQQVLFHISYHLCLNIFTDSC